MYYYTLFDQIVKSQIELPEAIMINETEQYDILIDEGELPETVSDDIEKGYFDLIEEKKAWFYVRNLCVYYIENGNHILIHKMGEVNELSVMTYLTGVAFGIVLTQKGLVPLHGSAFDYKGKGFILTGTSGSGKSSTMAELLDNGATFMADDIATVDTAKMELLPGFPTQKLCRDQVVMRGMDLSKLRYIGEEKDKFACRLDEERYIYERRELKGIFIISKSDSINEVVVKELNGFEKLTAIANNIYCAFMVKKMKTPPATMKKYLNIAEHVKVFYIERPNGVDTLKEVVDKVLINCNNFE